MADQTHHDSHNLMHHHNGNHDLAPSGFDPNHPIAPDFALAWGGHPVDHHGFGHADGHASIHTDMLNPIADHSLNHLPDHALNHTLGQESTPFNSHSDLSTFDHPLDHPFDHSQDHQDLKDLSHHGFDPAIATPSVEFASHTDHHPTIGSPHDSYLVSPSESIAAPTLSHSLETHSSACSSPIHPGDDRSVKVYDDGDVHWNDGGKVGTVSGHKYYDSSGNLLGILKSNLEVVNANGHVLGHVTPGGCAYAGTGSDSTLFASEGSARWAAATLIFNLSRA